MTYILTVSCPENAIVQRLPSGDYDLSHCGSVLAAIDEEDQNTDLGDGEKSYEDIIKEIEASISAYTPEEVLEAAKAGYEWPLEMNFVIHADDPSLHIQLEDFLMPKIEYQIDKFINDFDTATLEDIESEFFGENDQLDIMIKEKSLEDYCRCWDYLRRYQYNAVDYLKDYFKTD